MRTDSIRSQCPFMNVQFEIYAEGELDDDREEEPRPKRAVEGMGKLSASMCVSEDDTSKRQCECEALWRLRSSEGGLLRVKRRDNELGEGHASDYG